MKHLAVIFVSVMLMFPACTFAAMKERRTVSPAQAEALVFSALPDHSRMLPNLTILANARLAEAPQFFFFDVVWEGKEGGGVSVGHYFVNADTADVTETLISPCAPLKSRRLQALQEEVRKGLRLSGAAYRKLRVTPPFCFR